MPAEDGDSLFKPAQPRRAFEEIIRQIQALIADGRLRPGDKLPPERTLAAQFEVSRNTLREALRTLEISGAITLRRGASGGAFVAAPEARPPHLHLSETLRFTDFSVADLTQAMRAVTLMLFQAALPTLTDEDLAAMEANIREAEAIRDDPPARSAVLIRFYVLLAEASRNKILVMLAEALSAVLLSWVVRLGPLSGDRVIVSRRTIVRLLRTGDTAAAQAELEEYLEALHRHWLEGSGTRQP